MLSRSVLGRLIGLSVGVACVRSSVEDNSGIAGNFEVADDGVDVIAVDVAVARPEAYDKDGDSKGEVAVSPSMVVLLFVPWIGKVAVLDNDEGAGRNTDV